jgi:hypothetical protein
MFQTKVVEKSKHILCSMTLFRKSYRLRDNVEKYGTPRQATYYYVIQRMRFACCRTRATNTHSEHEILIAFPWQQCFGERASMLHYTYIACCYCFLAPAVSTELLFFYWLYIPGWDLTSVSFCHFSLDCPLILKFLYPTRATSSTSSHHLSFGLPLCIHFLLVCYKGLSLQDRFLPSSWPQRFRKMYVFTRALIFKTICSDVGALV